MAKDKKKKDPEKKAALQAKREAKVEKLARKRLQKEGLGSSNNDNPDAELDDLLQAYRRKHPDVQTTVLEPLETDFPAARANASFTLAEDSNKIYLFGGEYYDGVENVVVDELIQFDINKQEWKRIITPLPRPGARCAHSTVYYKQALYVFGGEFATAESYHHFKDVWKFDLTEKKWIELSPQKGTAATPPTARSGHAAFVWKNYMIIFGGFYEAQRDTKWYQDVHVLDLLTEKWVQLPEPSRLSSRPEARSACNVAVLTDAAVIQGGFSKLKKTVGGAPMGTASSYESKVHTDAWKLHLTPLLQNKPPTWERLPHIKSNSLTLTPLGRAGMSSITYRNQLLAWGGVCDTEHHHHVMQSVFYNDLWVMDLEKRKWYSIRIQEKRAGQPDKQRRRRRRKQPTSVTTNEGANQQIEQDDDDDGDGDGENDAEEDLVDEEAEGEDASDANLGWDLDKLRSSMFAFIDAKGNIVYEKIADDDKRGVAHNRKSAAGDDEDEEKEEEKGVDEDEEEEKEEEIESKFSRISFSEGRIDAKADNVISTKDSSYKTLTSSSVMALNPETRLPEPVVGFEPLPRINAELVLYGNTLYVYGGLLEVGDREVTLDDLWRLDLRKRDKWECVYPGTMHKQVWRGATHDDDDSYVSTGADDDDDEDENDDDEASEDDDDELDAATVKAHKKEEEVANQEKKRSKRSILRQEIANLREEHDLNDLQRTPQTGEAVADFYARTSEYWNEQATAAAQHEGLQPLSTKDLRRDGFNLARKRVDDLKPIMDRLNELDQLYREADREKKGFKEERDEKKKSRRYR